MIVWVRDGFCKDRHELIQNVSRDIDFWENAAGDHQPLNLCSAFKDIEDFRVAEPFLNKLFVGRIFAWCRNAYRRCCCLHH